MAKKLKSIRDSHHKQRIEYPWHDWADGGAWRLERGDDFECRVDSFRQAVYRFANKTYRKARTVVVSETEIEIQFYGGKR